MNERRVLTLILVLVGVAAGYVSFTHVHDWTMAHVPAGTPGTFGWINAVISELGPVASALEIRRRRALGKPIGFPVFLLLAFASLSLAAQLAVAVPTASGWLLSAVPAVAFMLLVKLALGHIDSETETPAQPAAPTPAPLPVPAPAPLALPAMRQPAVAPMGVHTLPIVPVQPAANFSAGARITWVTAPADATVLPLVPAHRPRPTRPRTSGTSRPRTRPSKTGLSGVEIATRARAIMAERKISQVALASELGVSRRRLRDVLATAA